MNLAKIPYMQGPICKCFSLGVCAHSMVMPKRLGPSCQHKVSTAIMYLAAHIYVSAAKHELQPNTV